MTQQEEKAMLAEFMGWDKEYKSVYYKSFEAIALIALMKLDSYGSLMEVVEKIESLVLPNNDSITVSILNNCCSIFSFLDATYNKRHTEKTKLSAIYSACVAFIEWWNEQQSQQS